MLSVPFTFFLETFGSAKRLPLDLLWIGIASAALFALIGFLAGRRITRPLSALSQSIKRSRDGSTEKLVPASGYHEIDELTNSFNALISDLFKKNSALTEMNASLRRCTDEKTLEPAPAPHIVSFNEKRIESIIELVQDAYIAIDRNGVVTDWNSQSEKMFGWRKHEAIGQILSILVLPERFWGAYQNLISNHHEDGRVDFLNRRMEYTVVDRVGKEFQIEATIGLVTAEDSYFFSAFVHDISERRENERMKTEFISTVSHELRTPLTSIRASLSMLAGDMAGELPADARTLLHIAHGGCERLVRLVNDILDIEKLESGKMKYDMVGQSLDVLGKLACDAMQGFASQYQVNVTLHCDASAFARVDRDRLIQVVTNLLSNAIKFSAPGGIVALQIRRDGNSIHMSVVDHGAGIPEGFRDRVFQKFAQADATDSRQKGGTGLGLSICKNIVEEHGGVISFASEEGIGTTFNVELPAAEMEVDIENKAALL